MHEIVANETLKTNSGTSETAPNEQGWDSAFGTDILAGISVFSRFSREEIEELFELGEQTRLRTGAHAVIEGEPSRGMYVLLSGHVSVYKTDDTTGALMRLAHLGAGASFGELSLFDDAPRSATVVADSPCRMFHLDERRFRSFLEQKGADLQIRFYKTCAEDLATRFRSLNSDYINAQKLLWRYALRTDEGQGHADSGPLAKNSRSVEPDEPV